MGNKLCNCQIFDGDKSESSGFNNNPNQVSLSSSMGITPAKGKAIKEYRNLWEGSICSSNKTNDNFNNSHSFDKEDTKKLPTIPSGNESKFESFNNNVINTSNKNILDNQQNVTPNDESGGQYENKESDFSIMNVKGENMESSNFGNQLMNGSLNNNTNNTNYIAFHEGNSDDVCRKLNGVNKSENKEDEKEITSNYILNEIGAQDKNDEKIDSENKIEKSNVHWVSNGMKGDTNKICEQNTKSSREKENPKRTFSLCDGDSDEDY